MDMISRRALRHAAILCCFTTLFGACARPTPSHASVQVTKRDSSGVVLVELSISPTAMARGLTDVDTLRPDLDIAPSGESARGYISDVIGRTDGSIITLDREVDSVRVYTATGRRTQAWAVRIDSLHRRASPLAIVGLGSEVAVLNPHRRGALLAYSADGQLAAEYVGSTYADWESLLARGPFVYYAINVAEGPEDYTRRIGALSDSTFVVEERPADAAARQTDAVLVVHDKRLRTRDTVATLPLAPLAPRTSGRHWRYEPVRAADVRADYPLGHVRRPPGAERH